MNAEQKAELKRRLQSADDLERRIKYLTQGIKDVTGGETFYLAVPLANDYRLMYRKENKKPEGFYDICWSDEEDGFGQEIKDAVLAALNRRLDQAKAEYEAL